MRSHIPFTVCHPCLVTTNCSCVPGLRVWPKHCLALSCHSKLLSHTLDYYSGVWYTCTYCFAPSHPPPIAESTVLLFLPLSLAFVSHHHSGQILFNSQFTFWCVALIHVPIFSCCATLLALAHLDYFSGVTITFFLKLFVGFLFFFNLQSIFQVRYEDS